MRPLRSALVLACCLTHRAAAQATVMRHVVQSVVFDSVANRPLADATVQLAWRAFALDAGNYRTVTERAAATIEDGGSYLACHLPIDTPLDLQVTGAGHRAVSGTVAVAPAGGIGRLDVALADSARDRGPAIIRGRETRASGKAVSTGRVAITSLGREVPIEAGAVVLVWTKNRPRG